LPTIIYVSWDINRDPTPQFSFQISKLIFDSLLGVEVQKPTQPVKTAKGSGNTFDLNPKWARTLPSLIYFAWDMYRDPTPQLFFKYQS
jgi:hypothetical protein